MLLAHVHGVMKDGRGGPEARRVVVFLDYVVEQVLGGKSRR